MFAAGPQYLSAAVLYESMVIESYGQNLQFPVVAIYPKEGTFWSDHPIGIVNRDWVTPAHKEAAQIYIKYLLARPQQERAMQYGFRPGAVDVPFGSAYRFSSWCRSEGTEDDARSTSSRCNQLGSRNLETGQEECRYCARA